MKRLIACALLLCALSVPTPAQDFAESLTQRAATLAVVQFSSALRVYTPLAADPIACAAAYKGLAYYNTVSNTPKVCNGTSWLTLQTTATAPGGSSGDIQYNNAGAFGGKSIATLKSDLSLNNVDNTSDATKNAASATLTNKTIPTITGPTLFTGQYNGALNDEGNTSTAITINWNEGNVQYVTMTGNATFTFTNPVSGGRYVLMLKQDATGSRLATWPVTVLWSGGAAPTLTVTAAKVDIITFVYDGVNTKYYGGSVLNF